MIRDLTTEDLDRLKEIHEAQGYTFLLPDLTNPTVICKKVFADEQNRARVCAIGDLHLSVMLLVDPNWATPADRLAAIEELQRAGFAEAAKLGVSIAMTQADGRFAERMKAMGWTEAPGRLFYRQVP